MALGKYNSRKFILVCWAMGLLTMDLWQQHYLSGIQWVSALVAILGMYKAAEVVDKRMNGDGR